MTLAELDALERDVLASELAASPALFAEAISRGDAEPWYPYRHLEFVNRRLMALVEGRLPGNRLMITLPPRHGKSLLCSLYLPAWYLNKYPDRRIILCSYGDDYAAEWGRKVRDLITSNGDKLHVSVDQGSKAQDRWDIAGTAGGMKTAGAGGAITGRGANLFIIDDPVKNSEEANSVTDREKKWNWWRGDAHSRLQPVTKGGKRVLDPVVLVIQTRWHEDDLAGRMLLNEGTVQEGGLWTVINLPALAEEGDPLGRQIGEALCPERYDENALGAIRETAGPTAFSALYQQRPQPEGGGAFKRDTFQYWRQTEDEGFTYRLADKKDGHILAPQADCWRFVTIDLAVTARTSSDWTVAAVWDVAAWLEPSRLILRHLDRVRIEGAEHVTMVKDLYDQWQPSFIGIEEAMQGTQTIDFGRRMGIPVIGLRHRSKDKAFRAKDAQLMCELGRVYFPERAAWLGEFEHELLLFPSGVHDDQVDVFSYAAQEVLRGVNLTAKKPKFVPTTPTERAWANVARMTKDAERRRRRQHPTLGSIPR